MEITRNELREILKISQAYDEKYLDTFFRKNLIDYKVLGIKNGHIEIALLLFIDGENEYSITEFYIPIGKGEFAETADYYSTDKDEAKEEFNTYR
ncbi:MAG: hypothetical protein GY861_24245 [bacterium]|nr:hypothetical protein [bacterium]